MAELYGNKSLTGVERNLAADEIIVSKTDLDGKITYGNRTFYKFAGYDEGECLHSQHNIVRHPEMPRSIFKLFWDTLKSQNEIFAYVNNRCKNGDFYWVLAHVTPSIDPSGNTIGYHSNRRAPNRHVLNDQIIPLYKKLLDIEKANASPKAGMQDALKTIQDMLEEKKVGFNQYIFSLGV